ncbi:hypothetical protein HP440_18060 [Bacillus altitudinis]|uniref:Lipoprotein n=1 Tax=Bacillus altitudinis TaxID=293387 RepID=A0A653NA40_BACAB|nr:hypothetical protein [Bacillus altitudinis]MDX2363920.1 hypothetical protein [Bacillus altitudinis]NQD52410.1 hypothetical protein [Bacillus altitudinis]QKJ39463.1 hypothetical protein HRJ37_04585 [Bacillus altitudinis]UTX09784.1 hypothetical protein NMH04_04745 [Bacillus altitudinis]VXB14379.1 conserved exported hypothetical protein [Bacillus altitudinis]
MIKKWSILLFTVLLLAGCGEKAAETTTTEKTVSKIETESDSKNQVTIEKMKLTKKEKNLLEASTTNEIVALTLKGLTKNNKSITFIGSHYKNGRLVDKEASSSTFTLHQDGTDQTMNVLFQLSHEKDIFNSQFSIWSDKKNGGITKATSSFPFKVSDYVFSAQSESVKVASGDKALIAYTAAMGKNGDVPMLDKIEKNPKQALKHISHAYLFYIQLDK